MRLGCRLRAPVLKVFALLLLSLLVQTNLPAKDVNVLSQLGVTGGGLNLIVLVVGFHFRKLLRPLESYVMQLALHDLLAVMMMYPLVITSCLHHQWDFDDIGCIYYGTIGTMLSMSSIYTLTLMSVARFLKLCVPGCSVVTHRAILISLMLANTGGLFWGVSPLIGWGKFGVELHGTSCSIAWNDGIASDFAFSIFGTGLLLPAAVIVFCYIKISRQIKKEGSVITTWADARMIKMSFLMCGGFMLSWGPYAVVTLVELFNQGLLPARVSALPALFAKASTIYNPLIYFFSSMKFRNQTMDLLRCFRRVDPSPDLQPEDMQDREQNADVHQRSEMNTRNVTTNMPDTSDVHAQIDSNRLALPKIPSIRSSRTTMVSRDASSNFKDMQDREQNADGHQRSETNTRNATKNMPDTSNVRAQIESNRLTSSKTAGIKSSRMKVVSSDASSHFKNVGPKPHDGKEKPFLIPRNPTV